MSADPTLLQHTTPADRELAIAHAALMRYALMIQDDERKSRAYTLGIELNKLRRPEVVDVLERERMGRARSV